MHELNQLLNAPGPTLMGAAETLGRLLAAGLLGTVIAFLYRRARRGPARNAGLRPTLVLLSMLIALVTLAVGSNVAVAFTLVGTLAIVRFRTTVSDVRDTAFVIFAVAVGIAAGQNLITAILGTVAIGTVVEILRLQGSLSEGSSSDGSSSDHVSSAPRRTLRITITPPNDDPSLYLPLLRELGVTAEIEEAQVDRDRSRLRLTFGIYGCVADSIPTLTTRLLENPEVVEASVEA